MFPADPASYQSLGRAATSPPSFITERSLISPVHKAGSSQWKSKRNALLGVEKHLSALPETDCWDKENNFLPTLAHGSGCAERDREGNGGCQGCSPRLGRRRAAAGGCRRCPCVIGSFMGETSRTGSPHGK